MNGVTIDHARFSYGDRPLLVDINGTLSAGEAVALMGKNGAGKTTLTRLLVALEHPHSGTVRVGGRNTAGLVAADMARVVAYVFQHPLQQLFAKTVRAEVTFGPKQLGAAGDRCREVVRDAMERVGIGSLADTHPHDLPPGEQKLVTIAAALAQEPHVLVLDEPTLGLDRKTMVRVATIVRERAAAGVAVLSVTHDATFVAEAFERVWVLRQGTIAADESTGSLWASQARLRELGVPTPEAVRLSHALGLPGTPSRIHDVVEALRRPP